MQPVLHITNRAAPISPAHPQPAHLMSVCTTQQDALVRVSASTGMLFCMTGHSGTSSTGPSVSASMSVEQLCEYLARRAR